MVASRGITRVLSAVTALALVVPALGAGADARAFRIRRPAIAQGDGGIGSFTPAAADPRRGAAMTMTGLSATGFRFTPASAPGSRRAVTVAVRARTTTRADATRTAQLTGSAITPSVYNLGVAIGWKRFALTGDVARMDAGLLPLGREAMDVGLSYSGKQWSTRVQLGADRGLGDRPSLLNRDASYSVDLGGSYALTSNLELNGGLRYKLQRERLDQLNDDRRDSQAAYVGTTFRF